MNRTIEQWKEVADSGQHGSVLNYAISDLKELARQRDELQRMLDIERAAWSRSRSNLLRDVDQELKRRKTAEAQRDAMLVALEAISNPAVLPSSGDPTVLRDYARAAIQQVRRKE